MSFARVIRIQFLILVLALGMMGCSGGGGDGGGGPGVLTPQQATGNCTLCHQGIEEAHPAHPLGCTHCHGGDPQGMIMAEAHVLPQAALPQDPTILPLDYFDADYLKFVNPSNLRVIESTCGQSGAGFGAACHSSYAIDVVKSMMATTTGHLAGGGYQNEILPDRTAVWGNFPITDDDGDVPTNLGALASLTQMPAELTLLPMDSFARHYSDAPRKICMRCHLWSRGKAIRGVPGQEGNYRSEGCAACHMPYTNEALSGSADPTVDPAEVGHPEIHQLTRAIPVDQCAHCHTRGARIGLSFRGLAQLPPSTPTGPGYPGLTPEKIHGAYHVQDPAVNPPDIHFERGLHCIDCHVREALMGDGNIYGHMDQATQIECPVCHGTPSQYGTTVTERGTPLEHLQWNSGQLVLTSKVTGAQHVVPQIKDIVDPTSPQFRPLASAAMNANHLKAQGGLECYTCHASWQNNCYGCHYSRDLTQNALDYVLGVETLGKPETSNKYFLNFKAFHMGFNGEDRIAPYVTGCQAMATVTDASGQVIMKQKLPVTAAGLSGLALNPVQPHTNRDTPRRCTECHGNPAALGLGTDSFDLTRRYLFAVNPGPQPALAVIDRSDVTAPVLSATLPLQNPRDLAVVTDQIVGRAEVAYVADGILGLVVVDLSDPIFPQVATTLPTADARGVAVAGTTLYVADGPAGVLVFDIADPLSPQSVASIPTAEARALKVHGIHLLVADGPAGLQVIDVRNRSAPNTVATVDLNGLDPAPNDARALATLPHYGNPPSSGLKPFTMVAYVADGASGVRVVDIGIEANPTVMSTLPTIDAHAVFARFHYVPGSATAASMEREYLYVADGAGGLLIADVTTPSAPNIVASLPTAGPLVDVFPANAFEPPVNKTYIYGALGGAGVAIYDGSDVSAPAAIGLPLNFPAVGLDLERVLLDRIVDEDGHQIKDVSHEGARPLDWIDMIRVLQLPF